MNIKLISAVSAAMCVSVARTFAFASEPADTSVRFAFITDTHLSVDSPALDDFRRCLADVNGYKELDFVIFGGDITDFGADREIQMARTMMDSLRVPYYARAILTHA